MELCTKKKKKYNLLLYKIIKTGRFSLSCSVCAVLSNADKGSQANKVVVRQAGGEGGKGEGVNEGVKERWGEVGKIVAGLTSPSFLEHEQGREERMQNVRERRTH